eukprot:scaffold10868_cov121-Isochrysis_galbana.AAC.4
MDSALLQAWTSWTLRVRASRLLALGKDGSECGLVSRALIAQVGPRRRVLDPERLLSPDHERLVVPADQNRPSALAALSEGRPAAGLHVRVVPPRQLRPTRPGNRGNPLLRWDRVELRRRLVCVARVVALVAHPIVDRQLRPGAVLLAGGGIQHHALGQRVRAGGAVPPDGGEGVLGPRLGRAGGLHQTARGQARVVGG